MSLRNVTPDGWLPVVADDLDKGVAIIRRAMANANAGVMKLVIRAEDFDLDVKAATNRNPVPVVNHVG